MELFIEERKLIAKEKWEMLLESVHSSFDDCETNKERAKRHLLNAIDAALRQRTSQAEKVGILFSGGVDSTFIALWCKKNSIPFTCYTVGIKNSQDLMYARTIAETYHFPHKHVELSLDDFETVIKKTMEILNESEIVWVSVGSVFYAAATLALSNRDTVLLTGLGAEELFAGYQRHEAALEKSHAAVHEECWNGMKNMWHRDLLRDYMIASHLNVDVRTPFMDKTVIMEAMKIHPMHKISQDEKKIIIREIAEEYGLAKEFAWRKKKAAQYGSNFVNGMDKLAAQKGFKTKKEYLQDLFKGMESRLS